MSQVLPRPSEQADLGPLVARVARGDTGAFAEVYDATSAAAFGLALRLTGSRGAAESVVEDVFLHVWRHAAGFDSARGTARTWILVLTYRRAVDRMRDAVTRLRTPAPPALA